MMPFPGGLSGDANGSLIFGVLFALSYLMMLRHEPSWRRTVAKTAGVLCLALLAVQRDGPMLLVAALLLSAAGDAFLAQRGERAFMAGLVSFLLAHIAYVALFAMSGEGIGLAVAEAWRIALALAILVAVGMLLRLLWPALTATLRGPVALYASAILGMGLTALTMPAPLVIAGAVLFMASDSLLAVGKFLLPAEARPQAWIQPLVWVLYFTAQTAIVLGFLLQGLG